MEEIIAGQLRRAGRFEAVLKAMGERLGADLRIESLAKIHGASPQAFSMAFTREMGRSPKAFLNRKLHPAGLLVQTDQSIKQVAHRLGLTDEYYFSRFFKRMNGGSPLHYRNLLGGTRRVDGYL
jgi:transcriptional regulator GlxA family with amidase domain